MKIVFGYYNSAADCPVSVTFCLGKQFFIEFQQWDRYTRSTSRERIFCFPNDIMSLILLDMGIPRHLVELVAGLYNNQEAAVRWNGQLTAWFPIEQGTGLQHLTDRVQPICRAYYEDSRGEL